MILSGCAVFSQSAQPAKGRILFGIDVLIKSDFEVLKGKKVGLLTNNAGRTKNNELTAKILNEQNSFELKALFVPEHGFYTTIPAGKNVQDGNLFGIPVHSLYNTYKSPKSTLLDSLDILVIDLQDIGVRSYTYISTMFNTMEICAETDLPVLVLDRANPLGGLTVDGNVLEMKWQSFVGKIPVSYIHGCTIGELAVMINEEGWLDNNNKGTTKKCDLEVIEMKNWERWMQWEDTGYNWYPTSPHIPTVDAVRGIATLGVFGELGIFSIGIGTTLPFQYLGAPGLDIEQIETELNELKKDGLIISPIKYQPIYGLYSGKKVNGFLLKFEKYNNYLPYSSGFEIFLKLRKHKPALFDLNKLKSKNINMFKKVTGTDKLINAMKNNSSEKKIRKLANQGLTNFILMRNKYLLY